MAELASGWDFWNSESGFFILGEIEKSRKSRNPGDRNREIPKKSRVENPENPRDSGFFRLSGSFEISGFSCPGFFESRDFIPGIRDFIPGIRDFSKFGIRPLSQLPTPLIKKHRKSMGGSIRTFVTDVTKHPRWM